MTLQHVVKQKITLDIHNWSSSVHQEIHKIIKDKIFPIVNQVDARVQNFEIHFLKEAAKFVRDFQSLTNEVDESLSKHKALELEIERLLRAVVSQDIMSIVLNNSVVDTSNLQTELERVYMTTNTRRPQPRCNTMNDRVPSASKSSRIKNKEVEVEDHLRNLPLSKNKKHMSFECNNIKLSIQNDKSKIVCVICKQCLITANHDVCVLNYVNGMNSRSKKQKANVSNIANQMKHKAQVWKLKNVGSNKRLASPKPSKPRMRLRWSPTGKMFDIKGKLNASSESNGDNEYDYSRYTWEAFLRSKDEAPDDIKTFLKKITVLLQAPVIIVRTDNDIEFKNQVLQEYFKSVGISHQASFVHTPQQNGVVERRNHMLVEAARTMLIFSHAPLFLWAEAIATACYTQNHSIIYRRFDKTPYKLINGRKPDISFLHLFGALCYPKNDREDIGKLGEKGDIGFFIGYSANLCAYRVYNRMTKKIIKTMNVTFDDLSAMVYE
ncbi:retrovirus-related pol polyprotein from transposon TNT 1-94 [Tanacetum coccineum]|uniref:Retrovirus-related pol polyprotein from transposon TNT 1-94 n=1 Tax=Tanacetum coccineum TaxID=301880 RepID=A0ABQ4XBA0_9ASTR